MGVRIEDLRERVRPIAKKLRDYGFTMTDLLSIGLLFLKDKNPNEIAELRKIVNQPLAEQNQKSEKLENKKSLINLEESAENIIYFTKFKLPSPEQKQLLDKVRKALGPEKPQKRKRKKA